MYFWKVDNLVADFKSDEVGQKEEFKYMLLYAVLVTLVTDPLLAVDNSYNGYDVLQSISLLIVSVWGVYYCYKSNAAGDNKDFIVRVICIGLPVMVRVLVFFIPVIILAAVLEFNFSSALIADDSNPEVYETSIYMVAAVVMLSVSYYVYLAKKIRSVSS